MNDTGLNKTWTCSCGERYQDTQTTPRAPSEVGAGSCRGGMEEGSYKTQRPGEGSLAAVLPELTGKSVSKGVGQRGDDSVGCSWGGRELA